MVGRITILLVFFSALLSHPAAVHEKKSRKRSWWFGEWQRNATLFGPGRGEVTEGRGR